MDAEDAVASHYQPVQERWFIEIRLVVQGGNQPAAHGEHLPRHLGVTGFIRLLERRVETPEEEQGRGQEQQDRGAWRVARGAWFAPRATIFCGEQHTRPPEG